MTRRPALRLEPLESRDAPATLVSATKLTYQDADGDIVTMTLSRPLLTVANVNTIFTFDTGTVDGTDDARQQLRVIDLTGLGPAATGVGLITSAVPSPVNGGDGFAALGHVNARGIDLGAVAIDGDLGQLQCGDADTTTVGLRGLTAHSMGRYGTSTGAPHLYTQVEGRLGFVRLKSDLREASIDVQGGADGDIGPVTIGGSLLGSDAPNSGQLNASGDIGAVTIRGDVVGGVGVGSGSVSANGSLGSVTVGGGLRGGTGGESGRIRAGGTLGAVKITGDVAGGAGAESGTISGPPVGVVIGGSLIGGTGNNSGSIFSGGTIGRVQIAGDVIGGSADGAGWINASERLAGVSIGGSLRGGTGEISGRIAAAEVGWVRVARDVVGGTGKDSGSIFGQTMGAVRITGHLIGGGGYGAGAIRSDGPLAGVMVGGSLLGGAGAESGRVFANVALGPVKITGDLVGGSGSHSGAVESNAGLAGVTVGGSVKGGAGENSGHIESSDATGAVTIGGDLVGGSGSSSGEIDVVAALAAVTIGGSLRGGTGSASGRIWAEDLGPVTIAGDLVGGSASGDANLGGSGHIEAGRIASLTLGGSLVAGTDDTTGHFEGNGAIRVHHDLGAVLIKGSIIGNATNPAVIAARGSPTPTATSDVAIRSLRVLGRIEFAQIRAGEDWSGVGVNADAQIGTVTVGGDWVASSIAAGAVPTNAFFGDPDDARMAGPDVKDVAGLSSRIASVTIGGQALGTVGGADHYGIVAEEVAAVKVGGTALPLDPGPGNDDFLVGITGDFRVNEI